MSTFDAGAIEARLVLDRSDFSKGVKEATKQADKLDGRDINLKLVLSGLDELAELDADIKRIDAQDIDIAVDADTAGAQLDLSEIEASLRILEQISQINLQVDMDGYAETAAQLESLQVLVDLVDEHINIKVDVDDAQGVVAGGGGGGPFGLFRILIYSIIALLPVLSSAIGTAGGALGGFVSILAGGLGALGLFGLGVAGAIVQFNALEADGKKLPSVFQDMRDALDGFVDAWASFGEAVAPSVLPVLSQGLETFTSILPRLVPVIDSVAIVMSNLMFQFDQFTQTDTFASWLDFFANFGAIAAGGLLSTIGNLIEFIMNLSIAFEPLARIMIKGLEEITQKWADWAESLQGTDDMQSFMDYVVERGGQVLDMLGSMVQAFINLGVALDPFAGPMLEGLTSLFDMIADTDPGVLGTVAVALAGLFAAIKVGIPAVSGIVEAFGAEGLIGALGLSGGVAALVAAGAALGVLVGYLVLTTDTGEAFHTMWASFGALFDVVKDQLSNIVGVVRDVASALESTGAIEQFQSAFGNFADVAAMLLPILTPVAQLLGVVIVGALTALAYGLNVTSEAFKLFYEPVAWAINQIVALFQWLYDVLLGHSIIPDIVNGAIQWFGRLPGEIGALVLSMVNAVIGFFGGLLSSAMSIFSNIVSGITTRVASAGQAVRSGFSAVVSWFGGLGGQFSGLIGSWFGNLRTRADQATGWVRSSFNQLVDWLGGIPGRMSGAFAGMFDGVVSAFKGAINTVIRGWNSLSFSIPGFDPPGPGPKFPGFTLGVPNIPALALGGITQGPTLAMIGEGREQEAVLPLSQLANLLDRERDTTINPDMAGRDSASGPSSGTMEAAIDRLIEEIRFLAQREPINYNDYGQRRDINAVAEDLWLLTSERG